MSRITWASLICTILLAMALMLFSIGDLSPRPLLAAPVCTNLLENSDMESGAGWIFGATAAQGGYSTRISHSPVQSVRLGITGDPNVASFSSMRQPVSVPDGEQLLLKMRVYQISETEDAGDVQEIQILRPNGTPVQTLWSQLSNDRVWKELSFDISEYIGRNLQVYVNVYNNGTGGRTAMFVDDVYLEICDEVTTETPIIVTATPTDTPNIVTATPTQIVVTNTPTPTSTLNIVTATPTPIVVTNTPTPTTTLNVITATPTPIVVTNTPTPTPPGPIIVTNTPTPSGPIIVTNTPTPSGPIVVTATPTSGAVVRPTATYTTVPSSPGDGCKECIVNGGFENNRAWKFGRTVLEARYVGENPHTGLRSALSGNANYSRPNYNSYSSFRQRITLPRGYKTAFLEFWHYTISNQESDDYQEVVILDGNNGRTLEVLWRVNRNDQRWQQERFDMTRYLGKSIVVYFNVRNRGGSGRASMYVDDVSLRLCPGDGGSGPPLGPQEPFPAHTPTSMPAYVTATFTPATFPEDGIGIGTPVIIEPGEEIGTVIPPGEGQTEGGGETTGEPGEVIGTTTPAPPTATPTMTDGRDPDEATIATITPAPGEDETQTSFLAQLKLLLQCLLIVILIVVVIFIIFFLYRFIVALRAQREQQP